MPAAAVLAEAASAGAAAKQVDLDIQAYQKARNVFANAVKEHLTKSDEGGTVNALIRNDIIALLCCPLTSDPVQGIQIEALLNVGKIGKANCSAASAVAGSGVLESMVLAQSHDNPRVQEAANKSLGDLSQSSVATSQQLLETGMLESIKEQLNGTDSEVKQAGLHTIASVAGSTAELAAAVIDQPLLEAIVQVLSAPELPPGLHTAACVALSNAASHTHALARTIYDSGCVPPIVAILNNKRVRNHKLQASCLQCLCQLAKHTPGVREQESVASGIVAAGAITPSLRFAVDSVNSDVRHAAAALLQQFSSRTTSLTEAVASEGCASALVCSLKLDHGTSFALPTVNALGHLASFAPTFARAVIDSGAIPEFIVAMSNPNLEVQKTSAWGIEQMAGHGVVIADMLAEAGVLPPLLELHQRSATGSEAQLTAKRAMKEVMRMTRCQAPLLSFVSEQAPPELLKHALQQVFSLMQGSVTDRREYVTTGALMVMQRLEAGLDLEGKQYVRDINSLFPPEVVHYYRGVPTM